MVLGGIASASLALLVYFASRWMVGSQRERISLSALFAGGACLATSGFLVNEALGYFAVGTLLVVFSFLLAYEAGE